MVDGEVIRVSPYLKLQIVAIGHVVKQRCLHSFN